MAKTKIKAPSINQLTDDLNNGKILPIYYLFGEDSFSIDSCLALINKFVQPFITSDFDKEVFYGDDKTLIEILDFASAFPFGSEKKLIIVKEFEKIRDKKHLTLYAASPSDFTVIVLIHNGKISNLDSEPFKTLAAKNYLFEAKELKGENLIDWVVAYARDNGKSITRDNARLLTDISGENRDMLEAQLEKISVFLGDKKEITLDSIKDLSTSLKEYNIFDLQNAISKKDRNETFKIAYKMLEKGAEPTFIIYMLTRYFTGLIRINELKEKKIPDQAAARIVGTHQYYYKDYLKARMIYSDKDLYRIVQSLLKADLSVKTTSAGGKSIISILLAEILEE